MDAIYTPPELADFLASASSLASPASIADFAAGDGALLKAAAERWPYAKLFGSDIDEAAVRAVSLNILGCDAEQHDFLADTNGFAMDRTFELILLNPPFSCRGNTQHKVDFNGNSYSASKALVFVARAIQFLTDGGEIIAILPASVMLSERDSKLLEALRAWGTVEQIGEEWKAAFRSHAVAITILRVSKVKSILPHGNEKPQLVSLRAYSVEMSRGCLSVHNYVAAKSGPSYIHTTDMRDGKLGKLSRKASPIRRKVRGPAVLVPRVGRPSQEKMVLFPDGEAVLSDCVIALQTIPPGREDELMQTLNENWESFKQAYGGSCAPYTTLKRVAEALLRLGIPSSVRAEDSLVASDAGAKHIDLPAKAIGIAR